MPGNFSSQGRAYSPRGYSARTPAPVATPEKPKVRVALKIEGDANAWVTIQHIIDPNTGWTKTTRAMRAAGGLIINTCARKKGMAVCSEALVFVPGADLVKVGNVTSVK
jgi:hypothetical protein